MTTSPNDRQSSKTAETHFSFPNPDESYSTMISNFVSENLAKSSKLDDESTFDHRPLLDLITQLNRRHTLNEPSTPIDSTISNEILPPKSLNPFRPMIVHKKHQVSIISFENIFPNLLFFRNPLAHLNLLIEPRVIHPWD